MASIPGTHATHDEEVDGKLESVALLSRTLGAMSESPSESAVVLRQDLEGSGAGSVSGRVARRILDSARAQA